MTNGELPLYGTCMPRCPLALVPNAERAIWPEVPDGSDVLNIGFAPGRDEVNVGRPFVGPSGRLLRSWLASAGLLQRSAFTNVELHRTYDLTCRHCGIDRNLYLGKFATALERDLAYLAHDDPKAKPVTATQLKLLRKWAFAIECPHEWKEIHGNREPAAGESCGLPIIEHLLAQPNRWRVVLCWGAVPARAVGRYQGSVGAMVGRFRTLASGQTCTVLYHPAYLLRQRGSTAYGTTEALIKEVLHQVADRLATPEDTGGYPYIQLDEGATPRLATSSVVDIETTTTGKSVKGAAIVDPRVDIPSMLCVGWLDSPDVVLRSLVGTSVLQVDTGARMVMHNAQYDLPLLMRLSGQTDFTADDTMVMAYLLGEPMLSLKILGRRLLGRYAREYLEKTGPDDHEYDAQDPHLTRELYHYFRPLLDAKGLNFLYDEVKVPLQRIAARHVVEGLRIDHERLAELRVKMLARGNTLRQQLYKEYGSEFNLGKTGNTDAVTRILYDHYKIPPARDPKTREPIETTNEAHIGQFRRIYFVALLLSYRRAMSYESRYTGPLSDMERVSGLYDLTGTGTDRVSQANRNCMNFPGLVKQCIQADEGGYFVYGDFSQIELRLAAYFSHDEYLLSVLREGRNMHEELCIAVYGARTPETYTQAKSSNFARLFGAGRPRRARTLKMPVSVVERLEIPWTGWDAWVALRRSAPARTYWGYERNIDAERESSDEYLREKANREVINSIIQGTAGETNQYAQVRGERLLSDLGGKVIHQEHDSVLGWVPNSVPESEAKEALAQAMREAVPQEILDVINIPAKVITGRWWG